MSVEVALEDHPLVRECSYCARTHGELVDDTDGGWMHDDPADCLAGGELRIAGMLVDPVALAGETPGPWQETLARRARETRWSALADAEMLAAGSGHITRSDVDEATARAIAAALTQIVERRDRSVAHAEGLPPSRRRGVFSLASVRADRDDAAEALARWMR